ncbi:S16 family serine protease [Streptomyces benahoarensis]|uniref:Lon proteolytic domain-containing protein n=1 Tax=Streptomyces benahoarensis TaxID=2595054 RepID=A0A553ZFN3_9ACTN|nr:S16 family serine protease [Streptomyces benahoarensis]TSB22606.1 hypothetical protein FNJ62_16215 [Streptomyces benahoarensis]TSB40274.1 hypothetical protein FNZ23_14130 [Streptomyces benahoarensis]
MSSRVRALTICAALVLALLVTAALAPLPYSLAYPGPTANVLGDNKGKPVITISGADVRRTSGQLRMTAIVATGPDASVHLPDVIRGWFRTDEAVMPSESVYPVGNSTKEVAQHNADEMRKSQDAAVGAALGRLHRSARDVKVTLRLADIGGPSAGMMFALGIIDKLDGDGAGGDLTGGRTLAGTGTIETDGTVGPVGGVPLKMRSAHRDGARLFLVPKAECSQALAERPRGMRLIPVTTLNSALNSLKALKSGGAVPSC